MHPLGSFERVLDTSTMKNSRTLKIALLGLVLSPALSLIGCSTADDNPITPDKMEQMRKEETESRGNFNPDMSGKPNGQ
jgi:hypothetical protein